jgi:hypothetical protein
MIFKPKKWRFDMENNISILFYARVARKTKNNLVPVYVRITVNGERLEHTTKRYVEVSKWSTKAGKIKGTNAEARAVNSFLDAI